MTYYVFSGTLNPTHFTVYYVILVMNDPDECGCGKTRAVFCLDVEVWSKHMMCCIVPQPVINHMYVFLMIPERTSYKQYSRLIVVSYLACINVRKVLDPGCILPLGSKAYSQCGWSPASCQR